VAISRLITTIRKNIESDSAKQFERQVSDVKIRAKDFPVFLKFAKDQGEAFIDSIDDWLAEREVSHEQTDAVKVGVGAFAFSDELKLGNIKLRNQSK
jgi:hypothetical protein